MNNNTYPSQQSQIDVPSEQAKDDVQAKCPSKKKKRLIPILLFVCLPVVALIFAFVCRSGTTQQKNEFIQQYGQETYDMFGIVETGSFITFGSYEQDNDASTGKEPIEWRVLGIKDGKALLTSKYALDCQMFHDKKGVGVTWETCTLRTWLNSDFLNTAFSSAEQARIPTVTVTADPNPNYSTNPGNNTEDRLFILSVSEASQYFSSDKERITLPTAYAQAQGAYSSSYKSATWCWLRTPGRYKSYATYINYDGYVMPYGGRSVNVDVAVCPALWIDLMS